MRTIIDFGRTPIAYEVTDEEFAEWERLNAKEIERRRIRASHDEAQALKNAEQRGEVRGEERANAKWQGVVAEKDTALAEKDTALAEKDTLIAQLQAKLDNRT